MCLQRKFYFSFILFRFWSFLKEKEVWNNEPQFREIEEKSQGPILFPRFQWWCRIANGKKRASAGSWSSLFFPRKLLFFIIAIDKSPEVYVPHKLTFVDFFFNIWFHSKMPIFGICETLPAAALSRLFKKYVDCCCSDFEVVWKKFIWLS